MMKLAVAAAYFDRTPVLHPDTNALLFRGQLDPYDDSRRDAGAAYRRILSVAPGTAVPGAVKVHDQVWVVGRRQSDSLGETVRDKYILQPATVKASVSRLSAFVSGTQTFAAWLAIEWLKDGKELESSSDTVPMYTIIAPAGTDLREHDVVWYTGRALMVQNPRHHPSGFTEAQALELEQATPASATLAARTYDPVAGTYGSPTNTNVNCVRVRWQSLYAYDSEASTRYRAGDTTLVFPAGTVVTTSHKVTLAGLDWRPMSVQTLSGAVCVHGRPA